MKTPTVIMVFFGLLLLLSAASVQVAGEMNRFLLLNNRSCVRATLPAC